MESKTDTQKRAEGLSLVSMILGICIIPAFLLTMAVTFAMQSQTSGLMMLILPLIFGIAGLAFGVPGLVKSIRSKPRTKKGVVFAVIGIGISLFPVVYAAGLLLIFGLQLL